MQSSALPLGHAAEIDKEVTLADRISQGNKFLLVISNGHGEDLIALRILEALNHHKPNLNLEVLPLVGEGKAFDNAISKGWLVKKGPRFILPSGGFSNQSFKGLVSDLFAGLLLATWKQWVFVKRSAKNERVILAVGDLLPLFFAWSGGGDFGFVGTPKSDYTWTSPPRSFIGDFYHRLKGTEWDPWECALMRSSRCKMVAVRDRLTARGLRNRGVSAISPGNPMMDGFQRKECPDLIRNCRRLLLLCGSRMPEALDNLWRLLCAVEKIKNPNSLAILIASASEPSVNNIEKCLMDLGYSKSKNTKDSFGQISSWEKGFRKIFIGIGKFVEWAYFAEIGLANAGTATEQLVGLGIPCVSLPGNGPQFNSRFALRQSRLLGGAVIPCKRPEKLAEIVDLLLKDKNLCHQISIQGIKRMGKDGGSNQIALNILRLI